MPPGTRVITLYGRGTIVAPVTRPDGTVESYAVRLDHQRAGRRPVTVPAVHVTRWADEIAPE